jgi:hypothetical protein
VGAATEAGAIDAIIPYVVAGETAIFYPGKREQSYWPTEEHPVVIRDARAISDRLSLETNGFLLLNRPTAVTEFTPENIRQVYYPEIEALVKEITGATRVLIFGDIVRSDAAGTPDSRLPARGAHVDYDEPTVQWWTRQEVGDQEAERLLKHRHVLINLWRPITTVEKSPLALCDASTVQRGDLNRSEVRGGLDDPGRETMCGFNLQHSERHRWYYVPRMRPDEIFAFKLCDSDTGRVQWTGHTAFDDPTSAPDAKPRQSIEIRTISFFEN